MTSQFQRQCVRGVSTLAAIVVVLTASTAVGQVVLSQANWKLLAVDSEEAAGYAAVNAFDGNPGSMWHTQWQTVAPPPPHQISIDLGASYAISGFRYLPRQDGQPFGRINRYEFYVSSDGSNWGTAVASGTFVNGGSEQEVLFAATTGRYVRLRALDEVQGFQWTAVAELNVLGTGNQPPDGAIASPALDTVIAPGQAVTFSAGGADPDGHVPLTYSWNFGAGGPAASAVQNPGAVVFPTPGVYTVTLTVRDALGAADPTPATRTVVVQTGDVPAVISHAAWRLQFVDSEEPGYPATNAFDGNATSMWHTQFSTASPAPPHELQIDLGAVYAVSGFRYLPRQDGALFGDIGQYEFFVSVDGTTWGTPVATGTFPSTTAEKQALFAAKSGRYIRLRALSEVGGFAWTDVAELNVLGVPSQLPPQTATVISRTGWRLRSVDSEEAAGYGAINAFDGNPGSIWHTQWQTASPPPPHEIQIDLGATYSVSGFRYLPRLDAPFGRIGQYEFYVSADATSWGTAVATGTFANTASEQEVAFAAKSGRYIRLRALTEVSGFAWTAVAELNVLGTGNQPPDGTITSPAFDAVIAPGQAVTFAASGTDPDGNTPLTYSWNFGAGGPSASTTQNPGAVVFTAAGTYTVTLTVRDALGAVDPVPATRTVLVQSGSVPALIPQTGWRLRFADSAEAGFAATNAIDGNPATMWHTQFEGNAPLPPHEIQIDLGAIYAVSGFRYLPRQDGVLFGDIGGYEFFVSSDGVTWGTPAASGTFASTGAEKQVLFGAKTGRYIRLRALSEVGGFAWTNVAELNVLGVLVQASDQTASLVPQTGWQLRFVDDEEFGAGRYMGGNAAFDGDPLSMWVTPYLLGGPPPPHEIRIDLGASYPLVGFQYLPNQLWQAGRVGDYEFYVSADGTNWGTPVAVGAFPDTNSPAPWNIMFPLKTGRYIRFRALSEVNHAEATFTALAELNVWRAGAGTNPPPVATIAQPSTAITIPLGSAIALSGTATDTNAPLSYRWSASPGSGVADVIAADSGLLHFNQPGTFTLTFTATDALGASSSATRTVTVLSGTALTTAGWTVRAVDSQESAYPASNAFDGNPATIWHTQWQASSPAPPHEIQIDLGSIRDVSGFRYLPRQDGISVGNIGDYAFFVSVDGSSWGAPVAVGRFAADDSLKEVVTQVKAGRYVRLRAYDEVNDLPYTAIAELQVLQRQCAAPSVHLTSPRPGALQSSTTLQADAVLCASASGQGVTFVVDGATVGTDYTAPFSISIPGLGRGEHVVEAYLVSNTGSFVIGDATHDVASRVGIGDYYVAVGDGITSGFGDDVAGDDNSADGRTLTGGYPPVLGDLLSTARGYPVVVVNNGRGGGSSSEGLETMERVLDEHPNAQFILFSYAHNDVLLYNRPSGLGLVPGQPGYAGSYKDILQQVINKGRARGKTVLLFKPGPVLPLSNSINARMLEYMQVIDELYNDSRNGITVRPPDGFAYYSAHPEEYADNVVLTGIGYQSMARLWWAAITGR